MEGIRILKGGKPSDWLDRMLLERITVPGQYFLEHHMLTCMCDSGFLVNVFVRVLTGKFLEFNYDIVPLFAKQDNLDYQAPGFKREVHVGNCAPYVANYEYDKIHTLAGDPEFINTKPTGAYFYYLRYQRKPDPDIVRKSSALLDYINGELIRADTVRGLYEKAVRDEQRHFEWLKYQLVHFNNDGVFNYRKRRRTPYSFIKNGRDVAGCVMMYLGKKEEALEVLAEERRAGARYPEVIQRNVIPLERAIETNTVEAYFGENYAENKAFIEAHYPFQLPEKWNDWLK